MSAGAYGSYRETSIKWAGSVPFHWQVVRLRRLVEIKKRLAKEEGPSVLSITQKGIKVRDTSSNDGQLASSYAHYQLVEPGDFAMNHMDLLTGWVDISSTSGVTSPDYRVFSARPGADVNPNYLLAVLQLGYIGRTFYALGQGSSHLGRWRLPADAFNEFEVPLPPRVEQAAIVAFLDQETAKIDALVEAQRSLIELLKEKRQAVISHAVTKGLDPNALMKDTGIAWLGEVPAHWDILPLRRVVRQFVDYRGVTPEKVSHGVPLITTTHIKNGKIDHSRDPIFIGEDEYSSRMTRGFPSTGDLLLTTEAPLGEVALVEEERIAPGQRMILMKMAGHLMTSRYLHAHFRSAFGQGELWTRASGSTASGIRADRLRASAVLVPPLHEQTQIVEHIRRETEAFEELLSIAVSAIGLLTERRSALISAAVTGKIDVCGPSIRETEAA